MVKDLIFRSTEISIFEAKNRTNLFISKILEVWEDSVKATHLFLSNKEINNIKSYVPRALVEVSHLIVVQNENNRPIGFMGIEDRKLEMLFIKNDARGKGIGKQLVNYGIENYNINEVVVNEQNTNAKGFYEYMGFKTYKRTDLDEQGAPYPVLYMKL